MTESKLTLQPDENRTKLLLVDDSAENLLALEAVLESLGQELVLSHSGSEALRHLLDSDFAAILLDVRMPDMDGFETAELIRSRPRSRHTPILFLTAFRGDEQLRRGYNLGAVDFLFKPIIPEILRTKVRVFVELSRHNSILRQQAEILREAEQRFRLLLEAAPDSMIVSTQSGEILLVNSHAEANFERPRLGLVGQNIRCLLPAWRPDWPTAADEEAVDASRGSLTLEIEGRRGETAFPAEMTLRPIETRDGTLIISAVRDITERKERERKIQELNSALELRVVERTAELRKANEALRRSNDDLHQFAYAASHDLREPLRMISLYSESLQASAGGRLLPKDAELLGVIRDGTHRMDALLRGLLAYAQVAASGDTVETVDCGVAIQEVLFNLQALIAENGATISWDALPVIRAHKIHVVQLFQNLIENSIKYRREISPSIRIAAERRPDGLLLTVSDNGIGIKEEYADVIFRAFKKLHSHSDYPGAGIGLSLCQRIAEKYRGKIWVESVIDQGSNFCISFPPEILTEAPMAESRAAE